MNYQTIGNLANLIDKRISDIPNDIDLVVGIPRSGTLFGVILALKINSDYCSLNEYLNNDIISRGTTRQSKNQIIRSHDAKNVLLVDDSLTTGKSLESALQRIIKSGLDKARINTCVAYGTKKTNYKADICLTTVNHPRVFEWNIMHHPILKEACFDIDGVLCRDPTDYENDDGDRYLKFISTVRPEIIPTVKVAAVVTSRLEKYRKETEDWLKLAGMKYEQLYMLDVPSAEERRKLNIHASFKAEVYSKLKHAKLFIESDCRQAREIVKYTSKPVFSYRENKLLNPSLEFNSVNQLTAYRGLNLFRRLKGKLQRMM